MAQDETTAASRLLTFNWIVIAAMAAALPAGAAADYSPNAKFLPQDDWGRRL